VSEPAHSVRPIDLAQVGFDEYFAKAAAEARAQGDPARVVRDGRDLWHIVSARGEFVAALAGRFRRAARDRSALPTVGDWVVAETRGPDDRALIHALLPRRTALARKAAGEEVETQVVAANIDVVFIVNALDGGRNFNPRRLERYLALAREGGVAPAIVLNKADLCEDPEPFVASAKSIAPDAPVFVTCALTGLGLEKMRGVLAPGRTCALVGPSGVGKSALVNRLLGEEVKETGDVRERDRRGRHTTSYRELLRLPDGALVIDTPGLREIQLWCGEERLDEVFPDIEALGRACRFSDCRHEQEPECAVRAAVEAGALEASRLAHYLRLRAELEALAERRKAHRRRVERRHRRVLQLGADLRASPKKGKLE
jgi:ribosome biogenesis GTPase